MTPYLGSTFQEEIATPLGLPFYIQLLEERLGTRLAIPHRPCLAKALFTLPIALSSLNPRLALRCSLVGWELPLGDVRVYAQDFEAPAGDGAETARAISTAYNVFATGGTELGCGKRHSSSS